MSFNDSVSESTKTFINELNQLLRKHKHSIDFTDGSLFNLNQGYIAILEDSHDRLYLVESDSGHVLYESEIDLND